MELVIALVAGVIGILVGGALNVLADDLPVRERPHTPHYPDGTPRPPSAWLGILAFVTGQREAVHPAEAVEPSAEEMAESAPEEGEAVHAETDEAQPEHPLAVASLRRPGRLSWRHPLVEVVTGLAFAGLAAGYHDESNVWAWFVYVAILFLVTVIDVEHRLILFAVIVPACVFALFVAAASPEDGKSFGEYLIGGAAGFGLFFVMFMGGGVFAALTRHDEVAFGFGDVMLATLCGLMIGWRSFILASLITVFAGAFGALAYMVGRGLMRRRYRWFTPLPYGPYIVLGTLIMLLFRERVADLLWAAY